MSPDFSARTLVANVRYAVDAIDAPVTLDLSRTPDGQVEVCTGGTCNPAESASLELERFVVGEGASGALTVVVDGTESTTDFDAVWCERQGGTPPATECPLAGSSARRRRAQGSRCLHGISRFVRVLLACQLPENSPPGALRGYPLNLLTH